VFAAILGLDAQCADAAVTAAKRSCAHEVQAIGSQQRVVFLRSTGKSPVEQETRIECLGGLLWLVGRVRLDGRATLCARLGLSPGPRPADISDALLCLHAYVEWGEAFTDSLTGDFCFALWDDARNCLLGIRDQLGVRALFHAEADGRLVVSDSLGWMATQVSVDRVLDDQWIADFLAIGYSLDFERTAYRVIRRLPPGHVLKASGAGSAIRRYWQLDIPEPLHLRDGRLYGERFRELMKTAIVDRLPAGKVGIALSGGLDSTTLAALAGEATGSPSRIVADCSHYEWLMPDREARFAALAARHLGIDLRLRAADELGYDPDWRARSIGTAEPAIAIIGAHLDRQVFGEMAAAAPVWFYGEGPDNALTFERDAYLSWLAARRDWRRLARSVLLYVQAKGFTGWAATAGRYLGRKSTEPAPLAVPRWLDRELAHRTHIEERVRDANHIVDSAHAWRPRAIGSFRSPLWQAIFADRDHEEGLAPLVWRHPYLDLRVLHFMLSVPPVPWAWEKRLIRTAMQGRLPSEILERPKTPLARSPLVAVLGSAGLGDLGGDRLAGYVEIDRLPAWPPSPAELDGLVAVHALDYWIGYNWPVGEA
jgi:asparagine synthase (glutamine-hydrolysing)